MTNRTHFPTPVSAEVPEVALDQLQLLAKVQRVLEASGYPELQSISIKVHQSEVSLHGRVSSYFQKQLVQELMKRIPEIPSLRNEVLVVSKSH